ncbi:hypothetical protein MRB53_040987 [Persea americana]|nr:hypothetical protein MRB53_040987 [Persea americana]
MIKQYAECDSDSFTAYERHFESKGASKSAKPVKAIPAKKKPALSEETVIDSSDEDTEEPAPKKTVNGNGAKAPTPLSDSSSEESESDSESSSESGAAAKTTTPAAKKTTASEREQQTSKPIKQARAASPVATIPTDARDAVRETHSTQELRPAKPFKVPAGYKNASDAARSGNVKLLDRSALPGKQLWYFSAPSTVDLSKLEELTAQQLSGKVPVFKQDDGEYTLQKEPIGTTAEIQIMLPDGQHFAAAPTQILASYKLQHKVTIPSSTAGPTSHHAYAKPKRQQPAGMRTRWRPAGAINSDAEDSDGPTVTAVPAQSGAGAPAVTQPETDPLAPASTATPTKKRKDREGGDSERKKEKKRKKEDVSRLKQHAQHPTPKPTQWTLIQPQWNKADSSDQPQS